MRLFSLHIGTKTYPQTVIAGLTRNPLCVKDSFQRRGWRILVRHDVKGQSLLHVIK